MDPLQELIQRTQQQMREAAAEVQNSPAGQRFLRLAKAFEALTDQPAPSLPEVLARMDAPPAILELPADDDRNDGEPAERVGMVFGTGGTRAVLEPKRLSVREKLRRAINSNAKGWTYAEVSQHWAGLGQPIEQPAALRNAANALRTAGELVNDKDNRMWAKQFYTPTAVAVTDVINAAATNRGHSVGEIGIGHRPAVTIDEFLAGSGGC